MKMSSPNQRERMLQRMEREKISKLAAVIIWITERVRTKIKKLEESETIMKVMKKLYEEPWIEEIARRIEFNILAECLNINIKIESKKNYF